METTLRRLKSNAHSTIGKFSIEGIEECFVLEDEHRAIKVPKETRIPAGRYQIKLRTVGGHHERYRRRFPSTHRGMLELQNIPGFRFILLHIGNYETDTDGCLLFGKGFVENKGKYQLVESTTAYLTMYTKLVGAILAGSEVWITITDNDR